MAQIATKRSGTPPSPGARFDWRVFAAGLVLLLVAALVALPFMHTVLIVTTGESRPSSLALFAAQTFGQGAIALALGLYLGPRVGLGFSLIPTWLHGESCDRREQLAQRTLLVLQLALVVAILGAACVILIGITSVLVALAFGIDPATLAEMGTTALMESYPAPWKWFLISLHAGIAEEIFFRLGLLTVLAWLGGRLRRDQRGRLSEGVFWAANLLAGLAFGFAHLSGGMPYPKMPAIMARIVVQNAALGVVLGWLYRRWGLESAILAHFFVDVVFYVILVPSLKSQSVVWMLAALAGLILALAWSWRGLRKPAQPATPNRTSMQTPS
jgi:membrane protease YdiL (CAAX protease family)